MAGGRRARVLGIKFRLAPDHERVRRAHALENGVDLDHQYLILRHRLQQPQLLIVAHDIPSLVLVQLTLRAADHLDSLLDLAVGEQRVERSLRRHRLAAAILRSDRAAKIVEAIAGLKILVVHVQAPHLLDRRRERCD